MDGGTESDVGKDGGNIGCIRWSFRMWHSVHIRCGGVITNPTGDGGLGIGAGAGG